VEPISIRPGSILRALISVMNQTWGWPSSRERHVQGVSDEVTVDTLTHGPVHDPACIQIQQHRQIQPTGLGGYEGDIACPDTIGSIHCEAALQHVGGDREAVPRLGS